MCWPVWQVGGRRNQRGDAMRLWKVVEMSQFYAQRAELLSAIQLVIIRILVNIWRPHGNDIRSRSNDIDTFLRGTISNDRSQLYRYGYRAVVLWPRNDMVLGGNMRV